ncbi:ankyrin repeat domain-containing protein [Shewanella sp. 202IG2-18]|uniref:ankyrin repeat domain-containing protein n=1 Tax=Parashewanella hymeniacidonis TaxID=2807618 RepID=UPI001961B794|nr:ankyrin repeat domain-containing protein [Parashewanella hymeniacidonis]MBM7071829.1 ankyrin repeat domain-containing protein [Parashewanella hymeniacidonis]
MASSAATFTVPTEMTSFNCSSSSPSYSNDKKMKIGSGKEFVVMELKDLTTPTTSETHQATVSFSKTQPQTPYATTCMTSQLELERSVSSHSPLPSSRDTEKQEQSNPLAEACKNGNIDLIKLAAQSTNSVNHRDASGNTPMDYAIISAIDNNNTEILEALLKVSPTCIECLSYQHCGQLVETNNVAAIELLATHKANFNPPEGFTGQTLVHLSMLKPDTRMLEALIDSRT